MADADALDERLNAAIGQLRHEYHTYEPDLDELKAFAAGLLPDDQAQKIEDCLLLRKDLRDLVHYMRHPDPALDAAADAALKRALASPEAP